MASMRNENETSSLDIRKNESPQLHENNSGEVGILCIQINAEATQVGKENSIIELQQVVQKADGEAVYDTRQTSLSLSLPPREKKRRNSFFKEVNDESDDSDEEQRGSEARRRKGKAKYRHKKRNRDAAMTEKTVHQSLGPVTLSASDRQYFRMSDDIMIQLQAVRDEGQWKTFDEVAVTLYQKYPNHEAQIMILIEKGQAACYSNRFADSKKLLKEAKSMAIAIDTTNASLLIGRIHYYLSAVYRREKKTGKAIDCVQLACQNLHHTGLVLDTAMLTYEKASALMDFLLLCVDPKSTCLDTVMSDLRRAIDQILALKEDSSSKRYLKTHRYAFIKMAMLLLDCRTSTGRQRTVSKENIKEAKKYLDVIRERYWQETTRGEKIQFFLAQSDLHYRMELYEEAEEYALEALSMAEKFGFNTEIQLVNDRRKDIRHASATTKDGGSHSNSKPDDCLDDNHDNSAGSHGNNALVDCVNGKTHSNMSSKSNVCGGGNHDNTMNDISANGDRDHGNTASDVCTDDSESKTDLGSSEGHFGDVNAATEESDDWSDSPSFL
ncbi:uncharacterized protein LOC116298799 [Actinia tenebrosa]|uniref:Uncharacterized protein LOC116298799 n=1 Tax=Actinia tenebrosa TaxID=6105 RepID=A0A6P8I5K8_ACTTE|nr:uncharacterized protein LOC116298799 [Actinia tenebrosa]